MSLSLESQMQIVRMYLCVSFKSLFEIAALDLRQHVRQFKMHSARRGSEGTADTAAYRKISSFSRLPHTFPHDDTASLGGRRWEMRWATSFNFLALYNRAVCQINTQHFLNYESKDIREAERHGRLGFLDSPPSDCNNLAFPQVLLIQPTLPRLLPSPPNRSCSKAICHPDFVDVCHGITVHCTILISST